MFERKRNSWRSQIITRADLDEWERRAMEAASTQLALSSNQKGDHQS